MASSHEDRAISRVATLGAVIRVHLTFELVGAIHDTLIVVVDLGGALLRIFKIWDQSFARSLDLPQNGP